jgi:anaerobic ribonucleoside-triphosphate reductase
MSTKKKILGIPCEIYTRVVGYFRPVDQANPGKRAEIAERVMLKKSIFLNKILDKSQFKK